MGDEEQYLRFFLLFRIYKQGQIYVSFYWVFWNLIVQCIHLTQCKS